MKKVFKVVPLELSQANEFVDRLHRHHDSVHRDKFRLGCEVDGKYAVFFTHAPQG